MIRHAIVVGVASAFLARDPGCGSGVDSSSGGVNAPCTRDKDCADGLRCLEGVCSGPSTDAGADASAKDAADDG